MYIQIDSQEEVSILTSQPERRTKIDISKLENHFKKFTFFRQLAEGTDSESFIACLKVMKLIYYNKGDIIFNYGIGILL